MRTEPERIEIPEDVRAALACPDCDSEITAVKSGGALLLGVAHDDTCPTYRAMQDKGN